MNIFSKRCTGHCCKAFILRWMNPDEILEEKAKAEELLLIDSNDSHAKQMLMLCDMLIPLGNDVEKLPEDSKKVVPLSNFGHGRLDERGHYYTCKHHDKATGNCMNYANRPVGMCVKYPSPAEEQWNGACLNRGCTRRNSLYKIVIFQMKVLRIKLYNKWRYGLKYKHWIFNPSIWKYALQAFWHKNVLRKKDVTIETIFGRTMLKDVHIESDDTAPILKAYSAVEMCKGDSDGNS